MEAAVTVFWWLSLLDGLATYYFVAVRQCAREANPFMLLCIEHGWWVFFAVKIALATVTAVGLLYMHGKFPRWFTYGAAGLCLATYAGVCLWHFFGIYLVTRGVL